MMVTASLLIVLIGKSVIASKRCFYIFLKLNVADGSVRAFKNSNNIVLDIQAPDMIHDPKVNSSMHQGAMNSVQDRN